MFTRAFLPARARRAAFIFTLISAAVSAAPAPSNGLLFYLSADHGTTADIAAPGTAAPTFVNDVSTIPDGAQGAALRCEDLQRLAWSAPGNIYAQRGTLSFFWRSRYPVGPTEFPIFRVGYADHSSWDMAWLRIDYNGHGFDAFVTDINLARTRVSVELKPFPKPNEWTHLALAWDETRGLRFYVNGKLAATKETTAVYDAALDQFGPHSRIISPHNVQSDYNFVRGGDIDEIRIYDRMLEAKGVTKLALGQPAGSDDMAFGDDTAQARFAAQSIKDGDLPFVRTLADARTRADWLQRYGWNRSDSPPPDYSGTAITVRKVEITDAYDLKRWWWKANDGIRETTWPGVYNRSRLPGRLDYFTLPDWDCYVDSGKAITFGLPSEPWNHVEIAGSAFGKMELLPAGTGLETASEAKAESTLFNRPQGQEKTTHILPRSITGRQIRFTNTNQEQPIDELSVYNVTAGREPAGSKVLAFQLQLATARPDDPAVRGLEKFIHDRYPEYERGTLYANAQPLAGAHRTTGSLPLVHVIVPNSWDHLSDGLDGIAIDLPAQPVKATHGALFPINIQVKDPLWPLRNLMDFTFSVKPGEAKTLWLDLRDRLLPAGKPLYLTLAGAGEGFGEASLDGAKLRLVFKPREAARAEHELDRFTQARDSYAMLVEEHPKSPKLALWVRFEADLNDLLRVNPTHELGLKYALAAGVPAARPEFNQPAAPAGVPLWAFRQTELLRRVEKFVTWYIDHRQSAFGDFGGGISDDVDLTNLWPGLALMGAEPEKIRASLHALLEAAFKNGMFTRGLPTIQADELHSYEEGINCLAQNLLLEFGSPRQLERTMETARGVETVTGVNAAGHRHFRSSYYSGTRIAEEEPWGRTKPYSFLVLQPGQLLVDYNGSPVAKKYMLELADGLLAHRAPGSTGPWAPSAIRFGDDREVETTRGYFPWHVFWGAWKWTGDRHYLTPLTDGGLGSLAAVNANVLDLLDLRKDWGARLLAGETASPTETRRPDGRVPSPGASGRTSSLTHFAWQLGGDKAQLEKLYATQIEECAQLEYINTEGSLWIDRVSAPTAELQRARLGGVALARNALYPGHAVSWKFAAPANAKSVALLIPDATAAHFKVIAYNLETTAVRATMTGWNIDPGIWELTEGVDTNNDDIADDAVTARTLPLERSRSVDLILAPRKTTIFTFQLKAAGTPYWQRPDLGIDPEDVVVRDREIAVKVHNVGAATAPAAHVVAKSRQGEILARVSTPALAAPLDLQPKSASITLTLPAGANFAGGTIEIEPGAGLDEITALNDVVRLP